jgi:hypothetical protein
MPTAITNSPAIKKMAAWIPFFKTGSENGEPSDIRLLMTKGYRYAVPGAFIRVLKILAGFYLVV